MNTNSDPAETKHILVTRFELFLVRALRLARDDGLVDPICADTKE